MDANQDVFKSFEVPDPVRIKKSVRFIRSYFPKIEGLKVLELGIAHGGVADILKKEGAICYGVDINPRNDMEGIKIFQADLNEGFPKIDEKFDVIFAGELIEHLFDDTKFVKEAGNFLKPGGIFAITTPNLVFVVNRFLMFFGRMPLFTHADYHYRIYNRRTLKDLLEKNGFKVVKTTSSHVLFSTRRNRLGIIFETLGDIFPTLGAHLIVFAKKT
jgi:2-polyprenyl-3-methyl-5-hydroxy-6-metoxy-1,4-benzoquinol methylase